MSSDSLERPTVLVADDDELVRLLARESLEGAGFVVRDAADGPSALAEFQSSRPDVVLLDVQMPGFDGFEVCRRLRAEAGGLHTPILMMTGEEDLEAIETAYEVGATDFVVKPVNWLILGRRLEYLYLANRDPLTGLSNRASFRAHLERVVSDTGPGHQVGVLLLDLNRFQRFNDSLGHRAGDRLLRVTAERITGALENSGLIEQAGIKHYVVSRFGGDEFAILLDGLSEARDAAVIARMLSERVAQGVAIRDQMVFPTASVGISLCPADGQEADSVLQSAGVAVSHAKRQGSDGCSYFDPSMNVSTAEWLALEAGLRGALERQEISLVYQPQYELSSGSLIGVEALMRWRHPELGNVPPDKFIPIAEQSGLICSLSRWALRTACCQIVRWRSDGYPPIRVAVNLSSVQFEDEELPIAVAAALRESGCEPRYLELELTEGLLLGDDAVTLRTLRRLKELGVGLAIDDFGTGYSALAYLQRFPIDCLKIDRSFLRGIPDHPDNLAIARAIVALGRALKLRLVAEGVETEQQLDYLRSEGCDEVQGFYLARPLPPHELEKLLTRDPIVPSFARPATLDQAELGVTGGALS